MKHFNRKWLAVAGLLWSGMVGVEANEPVFKSGLIKSGAVEVSADLKGAKELWLLVTDGGDGFGCDWADWLEPTVVFEDGSEVKLTEIKWEQAKAGWGEVRVNKNAGGGELRVGDKKVRFGIGTHAPSVIRYSLPKGASRFEGRAGLDKGGTDQGCGSTVEFLVFTAQPPEKTLELASSGSGSDSGSGSAGSRSGWDAAVEQVERMKVANGLEVTLFAAEPMVRNPANMDIDARGRVWVTEGANYRLFQKWGRLRPEGDRIVILEDTDEDGRADKETTFYQGNDINTALGICVLGNRVIVSCSPNVFIFTDEDGDDRADRKEVFFTGIHGVDHDHGVHAFIFGPDGKLYFNQGDAGRQVLRPDGDPVVDVEGNPVIANGAPYRKGLVFRCNPDGSQFEVMGHNFRNNYEVAVDSFGTLWQSDNDDDGNRAVRINYVMDYGNFGYTDEMTGAGWRTSRTSMSPEIPKRHWHQNDPGVVPNLLITGAGSPTGIVVYEGELLPKVFRNQMIHCDAGPRVVRAYPVVKEGAGYRAEVVNLLTSDDNWYRPSDVCVAPDGSIFVSDWNDAGVGGHHMADQDLETMTGRIYRVAPEGHRYSPEALKVDEVGAAIKALQSPNLALRYLGWTELHEMQGEAEPALRELWEEGTPRQRARAWHLLARIEGRRGQYVEEALKDENADIRILPLRLARAEQLDPIPWIKELVNDSSPQVRRECALSLRHVEALEVPVLWARLAEQHDGEDRWYLEALGIGADGQWDRCFASWLEAVGENWDTPAGRDIVWRSRSSETPSYLVKLIKKADPGERERFFRSMDFLTGPEKDEALLKLLETDQ